MSSDSQTLQALEKEAAQYEKEDDFLSALDVYEEIVRKGWANAAHLLALGHCYLKNRQRQNARAIWARAHEMEPASTKVRETLDHYFPGWESQPVPHASPGPQSAAPSQVGLRGQETLMSRPAAPSSPPPAGFQGQETVISRGPAPSSSSPPPPPPPPRRIIDPSQTVLSVETTSTEQERRPRHIPLSEPRPAQPQPAAPAFTPLRRETRSEDTLRTVRQTEPAARVDYQQEGRVNWEFVFADAAEGLVAGH